MKRIRKHVKKATSIITLERTRRVLNNTNVIRKFADSNGMVYFGTVNAGDETRLIKGLTLSQTARDTHYCVGSRLGRDLMFVHRTAKLRGPNSKKLEQYDWNILQIDLAHGTLLPHLFMYGRSRYSETFKVDISTKKRDFFTIQPSFLSGYDPLFVKRFEALIGTVYVPYFPFLIRPESAAILAHHFHAFDFECVGDELFVYFLAKQPNRAQLDLQVKAGFCLAGELEQGYIKAICSGG